MSTSIYHISDTHLGKTQYGSEVREEDYARSFDTVIETAIKNNADVVIHTGDLFDDRTPSTKSVTYAFKSIKKLDDAGIPFLGIVGNHERKWDSQWLDLFENLDNVQRLDNEPYIINDDVAIYGYDSIRNTEWENMDFDLQEHNRDLVNLVCMHELFVELMSPIKADKSVKDVISRLNIKPDLMPLGDYHAAEEVDINGVSVFYAGATERTSATQRDPTYRIIEIKNGNVEKNAWEKVSGDELTPRPFYVVNVDLTESSDLTFVRQRVKENVPDSIMDESVVVVKLDGSRASPVKVTEIYEMLENLNVKVPFINDVRDPLRIDSMPEDTDIKDPSAINIDEMVENKIGDDVSDEIKNIDEKIIRDQTVSKSNIRDIVDSRYNVRGDQE